MPDPTTLCIDIETYGKSEVNRHGDPLPPQTRFHPTTCRLLDRVRQQDLLLTCAITLVTPDGPGDTMVLELDRERDRSCLVKWLTHATCLWGMNLLYDLVFLRTVPAFRRALSHCPRVVDLGVRNYQHSELRPERSLKNLGPILGLWSYEEEIRHRRYSAGEWDQLLDYNAQDTHNTVLGIQELERRIAHDWPNTAKLSERATAFYSDLTWSVVHIQESGVCFSFPALAALEQEQRTIYNEAYHEARRSNLILHGEGSATSKHALMDGIMAAFPDLQNEELLAYTPTTRRVSWGALNRKLLLQKLPPGETQRKLKLMDKHSKAQKLLTSYIKPLLEKHIVTVRRPSPHQGNRFVFPSWHLFPGPFKDGSGSAGGTQQSRITATSPGFQTNPRQIKRCFTSRYPGGCIVASDLSQIELRVPGLLSGEPTFLEAFHRGLDLHEQRAIDVFGAQVVDDPGYRSHDNQRDPRQWAKQFNFADLYRAGAEKLRKLLLDETGKLFDENLIRSVVRRRSVLRPHFYRWQEEQLANARRDGYLVLPFIGQSRYLDADDDHNAILNFPIQTTAGNVLHRLKHYVIPRLPRGCYCFGDIYDALVFDHPHKESAVDELGELVSQGIHWLSHHDYWAQLQDHYDHWCPLQAETEELETWDPGGEPHEEEDPALHEHVQFVGQPTLAR